MTAEQAERLANIDRMFAHAEAKGIPLTRVLSSKQIRFLRSLVIAADPPQSWTCFHCGETFVDQAEAQAHFGEDQTGTTAMGDAACRIAAHDGGILKALRESEREAGALRHQAEQLEFDAQAYAQMASELERLFGSDVRTARSAWLKLEAMESRALAAEGNCRVGVRCQRHGFIHGAEAEELRTKLEALRSSRVDAILEEVDARDALAYVEHTAANQ